MRYEADREGQFESGKSQDRVGVRAAGLDQPRGGDPGNARCPLNSTFLYLQVCSGIPFLLGSLVHPPGIHVHHRIWLLGK